MIQGQDEKDILYRLKQLELLKFYSWTYANAAVRTVATGFIQNDIGRVAWQLDNDTFWMLKDIAPTWVQI